MHVCLIDTNSIQRSGLWQKLRKMLVPLHIVHESEEIEMNEVYHLTPNADRAQARNLGEAESSGQGLAFFCDPWPRKPLPLWSQGQRRRLRVCCMHLTGSNRSSSSDAYSSIGGARTHDSGRRGARIREPRKTGTRQVHACFPRWQPASEHLPEWYLISLWSWCSLEISLIQAESIEGSFTEIFFTHCYQEKKWFYLETCSQKKYSLDAHETNQQKQKHMK